MKADKRKKAAEFKRELEELGVSNEFIKEVIEIHRNNPHLVAYECKRLFNIKRNEEKLNQLNLNQIKSEMKPTKPTYKKGVVKKVESSPPIRRKSLRISEMQSVDYSDQFKYYPSGDRPGKRKRGKPAAPSRKSQRISERVPVKYFFEGIWPDAE